jgi:nicotinamidase-related amidase
MLIDATKSSLLIVDVQERLLPAMAAGNSVVERSTILLKAAKALDVPVAVSEQYPKGLGHTVEILSQEIGNAPVFAKSSFSCWRDEALRKHFTDLHDGARPQVIIAGIEAHVCVAQTAIDLAQAGFGVFVVADAVSSRAETSVALALSRMGQSGVEVVNTEMAVFELLGKAGTPEFKTLSALIK